MRAHPELRVGAGGVDLGACVGVVGGGEARDEGGRAQASPPVVLHPAPQPQQRWRWLVRVGLRRGRRHLRRRRGHGEGAVGLPGLCAGVWILKRRENREAAASRGEDDREKKNLIFAPASTAIGGRNRAHAVPRTRTSCCTSTPYSRPMYTC